VFEAVFFTEPVLEQPVGNILPRMIHAAIFDQLVFLVHFTAVAYADRIVESLVERAMDPQTLADVQHHHVEITSFVHGIDDRLPDRPAPVVLALRVGEGRGAAHRRRVALEVAGIGQDDVCHRFLELRDVELERKDEVEFLQKVICYRL